MDARRLEYFSLRENERPVETLVGFGLSAWPARLPLPGSPRDHYTDDFFEEPFIMVLSPSDMDDQRHAQFSLAMFGFCQHRLKIDPLAPVEY